MGLGKTSTTKLPPRRRSQTSDDGSESGSGGTSSAKQDIPGIKYFLDNRLPVLYFKQDILKIIHDLRISRWKRVEMDMAADLVVTRISGALTNAIYSVEPPGYIKDIIKNTFASSSGTDVGGGHHHHGAMHYKHYVPSKLLLRVYGPQAGLLIDREHELVVLERLALRKIGPQLLGTFTNGRLEQFLDADPLTKEDLWDRECSGQIAKRMRELHDGLGLLESEREKGPAIWANYDKWLPRSIELLKTMEKKDPGAIERILHSDLDTFLNMVNTYREWVLNRHGGAEEIKNYLVFAHSDTQYGNILRYHPPKGSPLLAPKNEHRQLVVIDFEYSAQNLRGYDICNHFCEWMSDYHHPEISYHIWEERYPDTEAQLNFIRAYVEHGAKSFDDEEALDQEVDSLMKDVKAWRPAVHIYWAIWGIVQATQEEEDDNDYREEKDEELGVYRFVKEGQESGNRDKEQEDVPEEDEDDEEFFDYVSYATQKTNLFWNDMVQYGFLDHFSGEKKIIKD